MAKLHGFFLTLITINLAISSRYPDDIASVKELFRSWKLENGKQYFYTEEELGRFEVFHQNLKYINKLNDMYMGQTNFSLNQFGDMSPSEFKKNILMPDGIVPIFEQERYIKDYTSDVLPDSFDWVPKNVVTSVKNQGAIGSCWAFSAVENMEGLWALSGNKLTNLSAEQIIDCDTGEDVSRDKADCGVFGGWPYLAYQYVMKTGGLAASENYPYCSGDKTPCLPCPSPGYNTTICGPPVPYCNMSQSCVAKLSKTTFVSGLKVLNWKAVNQNETFIAEQLMKIGPLSIAMNAEWLQFYHSGVFAPHFCNPKKLNHAPLLVGFGKEKSFFGEKLYWKVKNSWGPKWGENGYFRVKRNVGMCGINTLVTTAVLKSQK